MFRREQPESEREETTMDEALRQRIAERAYEISQTDEAGTDEENWLKAEQELGHTSSAAD
jgi:hypothetical protein